MKYAPSDGFAFTVRMELVVHVDPHQFSFDEGGLALGEGESATFEEVKAGVESAMAGFVVDEVNNRTEMPVWVELAQAKITAEEVLT